MLDRIAQEMKGAVVKEMIVPACCFKECEEIAVVLLALRYSDGRSNIYGLCKAHKRTVRASYPSALGAETVQGAFFYAGC